MADVKFVVALENKVDPDFLVSIGVQDESETVGKIIHLFNIVDPDHPRYRSTVAFMESIR